MEGSVASRLLPTEEQLRDRQEKLTKMVREIVGDEFAETIETRFGQLREEINAQSGRVFDQLRQKAEAEREVSGGLKADKGIMFGRFVRALAAGKGDPTRAAAWAKKEWGDSEENPVVKALAATDFSAGGALVQEAFSTDIIELLRPRVVVRKMGAQEVPLEGGALNIPKITGGAAAGYIGENQPIGVTKVDTGMLKLTPKKLAALVPISNDLLRRSAAGADTLVRNDVLRAVQQTEDLYFMRGVGTEHSPKGLLYWCPSGNKVAMTATPDLAKVTVDLAKCIQRVEDADVALFTPGFLFNPRTKWYLMTLRDSNGNLAFKDEMAAGMLMGYPFGVTTQIPKNLGGGANESEVYFADFADVVIGQAMTMAVDASGEAAYEESGTVKAAFSRDQTVIRVIEEHDLGVRHAQSLSMVTGVTWGL